MSERISEQLPRGSCSETRSEMHWIAAAPRISRFTHSMRRPPCGGRRMERADRDLCGTCRECVNISCCALRTR
eukprot:4292830-Lingulodinium_polyedra.AAC.1